MYGGVFCLYEKYENMLILCDIVEVVHSEYSKAMFCTCYVPTLVTLLSRDPLQVTIASAFDQD